MKRFIAFLSIVALMLSLAGCTGKEEREAAKAVSTQIENLSGVTLEDTAAVEDAQADYDALTDKARNRVKNYGILENAYMDLAEIVTDMIDKIGTVTLESESDITTAQISHSLKHKEIPGT